MQELLAQPQILKYKPLWEGAETDPSPAVAALRCVPLACTHLAAADPAPQLTPISL